jgi:hypothetical protein
MEDSTGIVDMFSQATKYVYMEWLYLPLIYLWAATGNSAPVGANYKHHSELLMEW